MHSEARAAASAAAILLLAGCTGDSDAIDPEAAVGQTVETLGQFWATEVAGYEPPADVVYYREAEDPWPPTECAAVEGTYVDNSFYCSADRTVFLNLDFLTRLAEEKESDAPAVMVTAHEWAHHLSYLLGLDAHIDIGEELQADCRAGVFVAAIEGGGYAVTLEEGDVEIMLDTLVDMSYRTELGWFDPGAHGDPFARTQALATGYETRNPEFCDAYVAMDAPVPAVHFEAFSVTFLPAMVIEAEDISAQGYPYVYASSTHFEDLVAVAYEVPANSRDAAGVFQDVVDEEYTPDDGVTVLDDVTAMEPEEWRGATAVAARYSQVYEGDDIHGILLVVTEGLGKAALLDIYLPGPAPEVDDAEGWALLEQAADALLRGVDP